MLDRLQIGGIARGFQEGLRRLGTLIMLERADDLGIGIVEALEIGAVAGIVRYCGCHVPFPNLPHRVALTRHCPVFDNQRD